MLAAIVLAATACACAPGTAAAVLALDPGYTDASSGGAAGTGWGTAAEHDESVHTCTVARERWCRAGEANGADGAQGRACATRARAASSARALIWPAARAPFCRAPAPTRQASTCVFNVWHFLHPPRAPTIAS